MRMRMQIARHAADAAALAFSSSSPHGLIDSFPWARAMLLLIAGRDLGLSLSLRCCSSRPGSKASAWDACVWPEAIAYSVFITRDSVEMWNVP
ncbi:LOW QUALITY PROTEIN: uncharacterized protein Dere_GG26465, partial [Drosophila erecta]